MKIAIVTGASSGLGREFALQISARYGKLDEIWVIARRKERLEQLADMIRIPVKVIDMDVTDLKQVDAFKKELEDIKPDVRILVNAAGYGKIGRFEELDLEEQLQMVNLNCIALTRFTGLVLPYMKKGRIINIASSAAFSPQANFAVYAASKAYVLSFSRGIGAELSDRGITVTAVCPGPVETEFFDVAGDSFKNLKMAKPDDVVYRALSDAAAGFDVSVYGITMKAARAAAKVIPHKLIVNAFKKL